MNTLQKFKETEVVISNDEMDNLQVIASNIISKNTQVAYENDYRKLEQFCLDNEINIESLTERHFLIFLNNLVTKGMSYSSLKRTAIGINRKLKAIYGFDFKQSEQVKNFLKGVPKTNKKDLKVTNEYHSNKTKSQAVGIDDLIDAIQKIDNADITEYAKARNKAIILLGFVGGFRRSELADIKISDMKFVGQGIEITLPKSKTNQNVNDTTKIEEVKTIPYSSFQKLCPVRAVQKLIGMQAGADCLFYGLKKGGQPNLRKQLTAQTIYLVIKEFLGADFTPHSLRAGFVTVAYQNGATITDIMQRTGHKDFETAMRYVRTAEKWKTEIKLGL